MSENKLVNPAGIGYNIEDVVVNCVVRGASSTHDVRAGDLVAFCIQDCVQIGASSTIAPNSLYSVFANVTKNYTSTSATQFGFFAIALDDVKASSSTAAQPFATGRFLLQGTAKAKVIHSTDSSWVRGAPLVATYGTTSGSTIGCLDALGRMNGTSTATARFIGIALESGSTSTAASKTVLFDGLNGFGGRANGFAAVT